MVMMCRTRNYGITIRNTQVLKRSRTAEYSAGEALRGGEARRFQRRRPLNRTQQNYSCF